MTHPALPFSLAGRWSVGWQLSKGSTWTSATDCWLCVLRTETSSLRSLPVGDPWGLHGHHRDVGGELDSNLGLFATPVGWCLGLPRCGVSLQEQPGSEPVGGTCSLSREVFLPSGALQNQQVVQGTPDPNSRLKGAVYCLISSPQ